MTWGSLNPFVSASRLPPPPPTAAVLEDAASLKSSQSLDFDTSKVYKFQIDANDSNGDWDYNYDLREIGGSGSGSGSVLSSFSNNKSEEMNNPTAATTATKNESNTTGTTTSSLASWAKKRKSFLLSHEQELKTAVLSSWERRQQEAEQQQQQLQQLEEFRRKNSLPMVSTSTSSSSTSPSLLNDNNHDNGSLMSYSSSKSSSSAALSSSVLSFPKFSVSNIKNSIQSGSKPQADDFFQEMKSWNKKFKLRKINNTRTTEREGGTTTGDVKIISSIDGTRTIEERGCMIQDTIGIVDDEIKNEINNAISYGITDSDNDNSDSNSETDTNEDNSNDNTVDETSDASKVAIADEKPIEVPLDALSPQGEEKTKHKKLWKKIKLFHKIGGTFKKRSRKQRPSATVASSSTAIPSTSTTTTNTDAVIHSTVAALVDSDHVTKEAQQSPQQSEQHQQQKICDVVLEEEEEEVGAVNEIISAVDSKCDTNNNTDEQDSMIDTIKNSPRNISTAVNAMMSSTTRNSIESISNILIPNFISDEIVKVFSSGDDASRDLLSDSSDHAIAQGKTDYYGIVNDHINDDGGNNIAADENVELSIWEADPVVGQLAKMSILLDGGTRRQEVIEHGSHRQRRILRLVDEYPPTTDTTTTTTSSSTGKNIIETESKSTPSSSDNVITHTEQYDVGTRSVKEIAHKDGSKTVITTIEASEDGMNSNNGVKEEKRNDRGDCVVEEDCREKDNELRDIITVSAIGIEIEESDGLSNTLGMSQSSTQRPIKIPEITFEDRVSSFLALSATAVTCSNLHSTEQRNIDDVIDNKENEESSNLSCTDSENSSMSKLVSTDKNLATISGSSNNSTCNSTTRGSGGFSKTMTSTTSQQPPPSCSGDSNEKAALSGLRSIPSRVDKEETRELPPAAAATYNKNNDDNNNANNTIHKQHIKVDNQKLNAATSTDPSEVICSMNDNNGNNNNENNAAAATTSSTTTTSSSTSQEKATTLFKKKQRVKEKIETKSGNKKPKERKGKKSVTSSDNHRLPSKKKQSSTTLLFDFDDIRHDYQSRTPKGKKYKERQAELATNLFGNKKKERTKLTTTKQQQQQKEHSKTRRNNIKKKKATAVPALE